MHSKPKVGILTFHRCINYGSYWQARCLTEGVRRLGFDAVLLDHRSPDVDRAEWRCALNPIVGTDLPHDRELYARKTRRFFEAFDALPLSAPFPLDDPRVIEDVDLVVIGSDEVWNLQHPWFGGRQLFYGEGLAARLVSYAASFGNHNASDGLPPPWSDLLQNFTAISVRDHNSLELVAGHYPGEPELVLDPCLQFADLIETSGADEPEPYAVVYGHGFPEWFARDIRAWSDRHGIELLSVGYRNAWAHGQRIDAGPAEFAALIAGASAVVTNFFHGCVFSIVNRKPFVCTSSAYRHNKVRDLLGLLHATERLLVEGDVPAPLDRLLGQPAACETDNVISDMRRSSARYLEHALH
jgi:hypothetical protein